MHFHTRKTNHFTLHSANTWMTMKMLMKDDTDTDTKEDGQLNTVYIHQLTVEIQALHTKPTIYKLNFRLQYTTQPSLNIPWLFLAANHQIEWSSLAAAQAILTLGSVLIHIL